MIRVAAAAGGLAAREAGGRLQTGDRGLSLGGKRPRGLSSRYADNSDDDYGEVVDAEVDEREDSGIDIEHVLLSIICGFGGVFAFFICMNCAGCRKSQHRRDGSLNLHHQTPASMFSLATAFAKHVEGEAQRKSIVSTSNEVASSGLSAAGRHHR